MKRDSDFKDDARVSIVMIEVGGVSLASSAGYFHWLQNDFVSIVYDPTLTDLFNILFIIG